MGRADGLARVCGGPGVGHCHAGAGNRGDSLAGSVTVRRAGEYSSCYWELGALNIYGAVCDVRTHTPT